MAENFDLIFGQSASSQYAWNDSDYQNGWETVGSTPPTAEQFDALQRRSDKKAQELNNALTPLVNQNTASNRQPVTAYVLKDIRYSPLLPTGWFLECTTAGTTDSAEITIPSPLVENATITDGTCVWKVRKISSADGMPIGAIIAYSGNGAIPSGYLLCDGAAYSRTALPDLFACIGTTYGSGDGSTTFNVPDANQAKRFLQGDTVAGTVKEAGLPNITGFFSLDYGNNQFGSFNTGGAFAKNGSQTTLRGQTGTSTGTNAIVSFSANTANPIYGNSDTVQPPALTTRYIIKAFDGQTADSALIDITQYENELGGKADRSLSNLTDAGKSFSFPSDTYVNITLSSSARTYTAPADGWIYINGTVGSAGNAYVTVNNSLFTSTCFNTPADRGVHAYVPIRKGQTANFTWAGISVASARFFYAQGEVPN